MPNYPTPALDNYETRNRKGQPNGYASLGPDGKVPSAQGGGGGGGGGGGPSPSTSVVSETAYGQGPDVGSSNLYSRGDHTHGTPAGGPVESLTAPATATSGTIATAGLTVSRVSPSFAVTGVILAAGTIPAQPVVVVNQSVYLITFAAAGISNVSTGIACNIPALLAMPFVWVDATALWYPLGNTAGGSPPVSTTYTFTGPSSGAVSVASTNFTVTVSPVGSSVTSTVTVTPTVSGVAGTFSPATVSFTGGFINATATFTFTPTTTGTATISVTNDGGLANPASLTYVVSAGGVGPTTYGDAAGTYGSSPGTYGASSSGTDLYGAGLYGAGPYG